MKQHDISSGLPSGFAAGGTYCGVCRSRVKLDLALLTSTTDCAIVMDTPQQRTAQHGKAVLLHHGVALPEGVRGAEITTEICDAAAYHLQCQRTDVQFIACGMGGQFFRPSLVVQSLQNLLAVCHTDQCEAVGKVIDTLGDVTYSTASFDNGKATMCAMAADGTRQQPGICVMTTDSDVTTAQVERALSQCKQVFGLEGYVIVVMANGASGTAFSDAALTEGMAHVLEDAGFQKALQHVI